MSQSATSIGLRFDEARAALRKGEPLSAVAILKRCIADSGTSAEAEELLGIAQTQAGNRHAALEAFRRATEMEPSRATAHFNFAVVLAQDKDSLDEAVEENQAALLINPGYTQALALQESLRTRIRERAWRTEEDFQVVDVGDVDPRHRPGGQFAKLECPICGGMNFATARVCVRCGSLIPEVEEIVPVE
jgi:tetratricopeptide (TPR) repeat protein